LFGCHVADRAEQDSRCSLGGACGEEARVHDHRIELRQLGQSEVENLDTAIVREKQVFRLQIAVDDTFVVGGREATRDLSSNVDGLPNSRRVG
jgi:hypothetical protein